MSFITRDSLRLKVPTSYQKTRMTLVGETGKTQESQKKSSPLGKFSKIFLKGFLDLVIVISITTACAILLPKLVFSIYSPPTIDVEGQFTESVLGGSFVSGSKYSEYIPPVNENLPKGDWIEIPYIGVRSELQATLDPNEALDTGIWLDPNYGFPGDGKDLPIIVAAHRYGWKWWWKDDYWKYNSFYNLPDTQPGDTIEITSGQRKYQYEIYAGDEGEKITDINADLILYTCKHLNSSIRHFRYARLIDPNQDTQK